MGVIYRNKINIIITAVMGSLRNPIIFVMSET